MRRTLLLVVLFGPTPPTYRTLLGVSLCGLALGCADLERFEHGVCGNGVIDRGEDCDSFAKADGTACGTTGPTACRYECTPGLEGTLPACPTGWGCGTDSICRLPTGGFEETFAPVSRGGDYLALADFDGDYRVDLLTVDSTQTTIAYYNQDFSPARDFVLPLAVSAPAAADLSDDGRADLIFKYGAVSGDLAILLGSEDGKLRRQAYPAKTLASDAAVRFFGARWLLPLASDSLFVIADAAANYPPEMPCDGAACIYLDGLGLYGLRVATLPKPVEDLAREIVVADFDETNACGEFALAFSGEQHVRVYSTCGLNSPDDEAFGDPVIVGLPSPASVPRASDGPGLLTADVNSDGHVDLLITGSQAAEPEVHVAFGTGSGTFRSNPEGAIDNQASLFDLALFDEQLAHPLAAGDLDGDETPDFVTTNGIWMSSVSTGNCVGATYCAPSNTPWDSAMLLDVNGDGKPEVAASTRGRAGLSFFFNLGSGVLTPSIARTDERVSQWQSGDFDGDGFADIAVAGSSTPPGGDVLPDSVSILFGQASGPLGAPVGIGRFGQIEQLARLDQLAFEQDAIDDISVLSRSLTGDQSLSVIQGSTDRQLFVPFGLSSGKVRGFPIRQVVGRFSPDAVADLAVLGFDYEEPDVEDEDSHTNVRLWLVPGITGHQLGAPVPSAPLVYGWDDALLAAADLDGDERDELVLLTRKVKPNEDVGLSGAPPDAGVQLFIARADDRAEEVKFVLDAGQDVDVSLPISASSVDQFRLLDVDGDGLRDLVVPQSPSPVIYWGTPGGNFDLEAPLVISLPDGAAISQTAWIHRDASRRPTLLLGATDGVYFQHFDGRTLATPEPFVAATSTWSQTDMLGTGDVNGDGVEDIVVAGPDNLWIFAGVAELP